MPLSDPLTANPAYQFIARFAQIPNVTCSPPGGHPSSSHASFTSSIISPPSSPKTFHSITLA